VSSCSDKMLNIFVSSLFDDQLALIFAAFRGGPSFERIVRCCSLIFDEFIKIFFVAKSADFDGL